MDRAACESVSYLQKEIGVVVPDYIMTGTVGKSIRPSCGIFRMLMVDVYIWNRM